MIKINSVYNMSFSAEAFPSPPQSPRYSSGLVIAKIDHKSTVKKQATKEKLELTSILNNHFQTVYHHCISNLGFRL